MPLGTLTVLAVMTGLVCFFFDGELAKEEVRQAIEEKARSQTKLERLHECIRMIAWIDVALISLWLMTVTIFPSSA